MSHKHLARVLTLALSPVAALGLLSAPASAAEVFGPVCGHPTGSNTCLTIERLDTGNYRVTVGIDVHMSRADAQAIIDQPGNPLVATIFDSDGVTDKHARFTVPQQTITATDGFGLSADFVTVVTPFSLDEDKGPAEDDIFARVVLTDQRTGGRRNFSTPEINESF